ncbi:MAG: fibronectin type III domain-containing protein, partial [Chitinophagaceae bacterium]|nr:fibronectin type III domain-containing protein [Chitinophagaceae bacterium]
KQTGKGQGTGYKQFERWYHEMKYHLDENGFIRPERYDFEEYKRWKAASAVNRLETTTNWTELGPFNWVPNSGPGHNPGTGRIFGAAVYPLNTSIIYVATERGGVWKTTNGGQTWQPLTDDISTMMRARSIVVSATNPDLVYVGTVTNGLFKTTDGGLTWQSLTTGATGSIRKILMHPTNNNFIYFTDTQKGIFRSSDGGINWLNPHTVGKFDIEFKPGDPAVMYACGEGDQAAGVSPFMRSTNGGANWSAVSGLTIDGRTEIGVSQAEPNTVYLAQASGQAYARLYKSINAGNSFTIINTGNPQQGTNYFGTSIDGTGNGGAAIHAMTIAVNPTNVQDLFLASISSWRSGNGGASFSMFTYWSYFEAIALNNRYIHADVHSIQWIGNTIYATSDGGVFKSTNNGATWIDLSAGLGIRFIYSISSSPPNPNSFCIATQDNGTSFCDNSVFHDWTGGDGVDVAISPLDPKLSMAMVNGFLSRTTDGGLTAQAVQRPSPGNFFAPLTVAANRNTFYGGWTGVYKTNNNGTTWVSLSGNAISSLIDILEVAPSDTNYIYAAANDTLYVTRNGGASWALIKMPLASNITDIAISPLNPEKIWVSCAAVKTIFASSDGGSSFTDISSNLPSLSIRCVTVDDDASETVYIGMNVGVYTTNDTVTNWTEITGNLPLSFVNDIEIQKNAGKLRVATLGRGIWQTNKILPPCTIPAGLSASNITHSTARIKWNKVQGTGSYTLQYRLGTGSIFTSINNITDTFFTLTNLQPAQPYVYKVRANCFSDTSNFSGLNMFTTAVNPCAAPASLAASNIGIVSAYLSWGAVSNVLFYEVRYKKTTDLNYTTAATNLTSTGYLLSGLLPNTSYNVQVWAVCPRMTQNFSQISFTTDPLFLFRSAITDKKINITEKQLIVYPSPAKDFIFVNA